MTIVGHGTAHRRTVAAHDLGPRVVDVLHRTLDPADTASMFLQRLLGVPVGFEDRPRRLAQKVELAQLVGNAGQRTFDRAAD